MMVRATLLTLTLGSFASTASAQEDARELFAQGVEAFDHGRFEEALRSFEAAHAARPHPVVLVNIANCHLNLGRPLDAAGYFERYLREADPAEDQRGEVERALGQARTKVARLEVEAPDGSLVIIDGSSHGHAPLRPIELNPGPHTVNVQLDGQSISDESVQLLPGETRGLRIDGQPPAPAEADDAEPPEGPTQAPAPQVQPPRATGGPSIPVTTWILGGAAVLTLAAAVGFGATALAQKNEFDSIVEDAQALPAEDRAAIDLRSDGRAVSDAQGRNAAAADVLFASTAVLGGLAIYLLLSDDDEGEGFEVGGHASSDGASVSLSRRF